MKKFEVRQWYEALECDCGGVFLEPKNNATYATLPAKRDYVCNKCGATKCLYEGQWPHMVTHIIGI